MKTETRQFEVNVDPECVGEVVADALEVKLLCDKCTAQVGGKTAAGQVIRQDEICPSCQAVINQLLEVEIERRVHRVMQQRGIPLDAVQIGNKH